MSKSPSSTMTLSLKNVRVKMSILAQRHHHIKVAATINLCLIQNSVILSGAKSQSKRSIVPAQSYRKIKFRLKHPPTRCLLKKHKSLRSRLKKTIPTWK